MYPLPCKHTHTHTHTQDNHACALVYRTFLKYTNKLNLYLAQKTTGRISLSGSTAFFIAFFVGIVILQNSLNILATEWGFSIKFFSYSVVCLFSLVCVGGAGFFYKVKIKKYDMYNACDAETSSA